MQLYYTIIEKEAARDTRIRRYDDADTLDTLKSKLTESYLSDAEKQIQDQADHHSKAVIRSNDINGRLLAFFTDTIAGVSSSVAAEVIRNQEWSKVMSVLNTTFTEQLTNSNATTFLQKLLDLKLETGESIQHFTERVRSIVSAIQEINQVIESKLIRVHKYVDLTSVQCQCLLELSDDEFINQYPESKAYVSESIILQSLVKACSDPSCRLHEAGKRFKIKQNEKGSLSVTEFFKDMRFGEDMLPQDEQVLLNVYETNYVKPTYSNKKGTNQSSGTTTSGNSNDYFCAYHSYGGIKCKHNTIDCSMVKDHETEVDPNNPKYHVLKSDKSHFVKRKQNSTNGANKDGKSKKQKECAICLAASKADSSFNKKRIHSHTTAEHKDLSKKGSSSTNAYPSNTNAGSASTKEATAKYEEILTPLKKILSNFAKTIKTSSQAKKDNKRKGNPGNDVDDDDIDNYGI